MFFQCHFYLRKDYQNRPIFGISKIFVNLKSAILTLGLQCFSALCTYNKGIPVYQILHFIAARKVSDGFVTENFRYSDISSF